MAYDGITTKTMSDGSKNIYVRFKYLSKIYPVKNFTKIFGCKTEKQAFERLQEVKIEISKNKDPFSLTRDTLNDLFDEMVKTNMANGKWRNGTYLTNTYFYSKYIRNKIGWKKISKITFEDLNDIYEKDMKDIKPYTRLMLRKVLKPVFQREIDKGNLFVNVPMKIKAVLGAVKEKESLEHRTDDSYIDIVRKVYRAIPFYSGYKANQKEEIRIYLMLIILTAHRHGELRQLKKEDFYLDKGYIISPATITKTKTDYRFPFPEEVVDYVLKIKPNELVFPTIKRGSVDDIFQRLLELTDITVFNGKRITLHDFRRFQLMVMIQNLKIDSALADACLNHKRRDTMVHYVSFVYKDIEDAYKLYWDYVRQPIDFTPIPKLPRKKRRTKAEMLELKKQS
jgi:integrase